MDLQTIMMWVGYFSVTCHALSILFAGISSMLPGVSVFATLANVFAMFFTDTQKIAAGPSSRRGFVSARAMIGIAATTLTLSVACGVVQSVAPTAVPLAACVAQDAIAKKSLLQMVADCGGDLLAVLDALLASTDPAVQQSAAYAEAARLQAGLAHLPRASR